MKKIISLLLVCIIILASCEKKQVEIKESLIEEDVIFSRINGVTLDELMVHFGVESSSELVAKEFESSTKANFSVIAVLDEQYKDTPELANKVVYLEASNDIYYVLNTLERIASEEENSRLEISLGLGQEPTYIIKYNLEQKYADFIHAKNGFDACFEGCLYDILDGIFNGGSWIRKARFMMTAPVEWAWHLADCTAYCL